MDEAPNPCTRPGMSLATAAGQVKAGVAAAGAEAVYNTYSVTLQNAQCEHFC